MVWESLDALPLQLPLPLRGLLPPDPFEPGDEADGCDDPIHGHHPGEQGLLLTGIEVEAGAHHQADDGIDGPGHRRPGEAEPQVREDDREQRQGGIVGHVAEEMEVAADDDDGGDQRDRYPFTGADADLLVSVAPALHAPDDEVMGIAVPSASWMPSITAVCPHLPTSKLMW